VALLAANVPYVPSEEIGFLPPEARAHEPRAALDGGADGLDVLRRVAAGAAGWLAPGGYLLSETSGRQAPLAEAALAAAGLTARVARSADLEATVVIGRRPVLAPRVERPVSSAPCRAPRVERRASAPAPVRLRVRRPGDGRPGASDRYPARLRQDVGDELVAFG
jgi:release factor glutamine methyltransferase